MLLTILSDLEEALMKESKKGHSPAQQQLYSSGVSQGEEVVFTVAFTLIRR